MKDAEFLELLNLYLDHEIIGADAARLEAEVQSNPDRRRIYHDYCRIQKACTLLAKDYSEQPAERKVVAFEPHRSVWSPGLLAAGGIAVAAACVTLVLVNRAPTAVPGAGAPAPTTMAVTTTMPVPVAEKAPNMIVAAPTAAEPAILIARTVTVSPRHAELRPMLTSVPLTLVGANTTNAEALLVAAQQNAQAQFEWMKSVQLAPIQQLPMDELRLDARSPLQPASRTYSSGQPVQGSVEMTAFRFQH
jgi:hypothetical protein